MSEAARLEQSFEDTEKEPFDLARVLAEATSAYQQLIPGIESFIQALLLIV